MKTRLILAATLLLAGCQVGPRYHAPAGAVPVGWTEHAATPEELARSQAEMRQWWHGFHDPVLDSLVDRTVSGNLDLKITAQRLIAARGLRDQIAGGLYPQINALSQGGIQRFSSTVQYPPLPGINTDSRLWEYGLTATWELDVFGRIQNSVTAQQAAYEATIEERRGLLVATLAELARNYMALRAAQLQLQIADRNIQAAQDAVNLTNKLFTQGVGNTLQTAQAQAELETQQASRQPLQTRIAQLSHAIAVLAGQLPGAQEAMLQQAAPLPDAPALPVALPSTVIANRPDIRRAERRYAQATARVGVAVAQLYPSFVLPLSLTPNSSMIHELFTASSMAWSLLLQASVPIYHGGSLAAEVREARANMEAARLEYEKTVLEAFREVEDRLVAYLNDRQRTATLHKAAQDSSVALDRARHLYGAGLTGFLDVLTGERAAYAAQNAEALSRLAQLEDAIGLYQAFGAGWQGVALIATVPVEEDAQHRMAAAANGR